MMSCMVKTKVSHAWQALQSFLDLTCPHAERRNQENVWQQKYSRKRMGKTRLGFLDAIGLKRFKERCGIQLSVFTKSYHGSNSSALGVQDWSDVGNLCMYSIHVLVPRCEQENTWRWKYRHVSAAQKQHSQSTEDQQRRAPTGNGLIVPSIAWSVQDPLPSIHPSICCERDRARIWVGSCAKRNLGLRAKISPLWPPC
jgi:hypothetical protein